MTLQDEAIKLARMGFYVFPLAEGSKVPPEGSSSFQDATRDPAVIKKWWEEHPNRNVGVSTDKFLDDRPLIAVDVDVARGKRGDETLAALKKEGFEVPETLSQTTPTGGQHLIYLTNTPVSNGVNVLGRGLDIRSKGGYLVGAGSKVGDGEYKLNVAKIQDCPKWIIEKCNEPIERKAQEPYEVNTERAESRAIEYLRNVAPVAVQGDGGDETTFKVAARVKDFGVDSFSCYEIMQDHWNERCSPPWGAEELARKIENAYQYGKKIQGEDSPEADFDEYVDLESEPDPILKLNQNFAFVMVGGGHHILWEKKKGKFDLLNEASFHRKFASHKMTIGDGKPKQITHLWMNHKERRSYDGICFLPGEKGPKNLYNLWRGFHVDPEKGEPSKKAKDSLNMFLDHALNNVCGGNTNLYGWLISYFAHLVQKPNEKPLTSLVFRGKKGTGKNALIDRVGHLIKNYYVVTAEKRYLTGNFNSHLENCLLLTLDEAFWSGDKSAEGILKSLITGNEHLIERKGKEPYKVANKTRVVVIGNEEWLVPATQDERRFAVFDVGDGRMQDGKFFHDMRVGMEKHGGDRLLLKFLLEFDTSEHNVNSAPSTVGLLDQKLKSLNPIHQWWVEKLRDGCIEFSDFSEGDWQKIVPKNVVRESYKAYLKDRQIHSRVSDDVSFSKLLKACVPALDFGRRRFGENSRLAQVFVFPDLETCRNEWEKYIGHEMEWD